jgi:hypothetical protein
VPKKNPEHYSVPVHVRKKSGRWLKKWTVPAKSGRLDLHPIFHGFYVEFSVTLASIRILIIAEIDQTSNHRQSIHMEMTMSALIIKR